MNTTELYEKITNQLIEILDTHKKLDYSCNWTPAEVMARNVVTGRNYNGINQIYLSFVASRHYSFNRWITFKQGYNLHATVKKGEKSRLVTFWKFKYYHRITGKDITKEIDAILNSGGLIPAYAKEVPFLKYYNVFNVEQFDNLPEQYLVPETIAAFTEHEKDGKAEEFVNSTGAVIEYKARNLCYYLPTSDKIVLCKPEQFTGKEAYYSVLFHELGHWTGHEKRMNRDVRNSFGSQDYAFEELVAEFFSAFVSAQNGFTSKITSNAAYIESWLTALENDRKYAFLAASKAQKAANFVTELVAKDFVSKI
jgi:antirestriction protein ArdC